MTPGARVQAATEILDEILAGEAAEKALTNWGRRSRYAGSKDRLAVRDHVFQALRCQRSHAALGGALTGRGLMIGALRAEGLDPADLFHGEGHAPKPLDEAEQVSPRAFESVAEENDLPEWLWPLFERSLGDQALEAAQALRSRAPVHLRVNLRKGDRDAAIKRLAEGGIIAEPQAVSPSALTVTDGARRVKNSESYLQGFVELQDAASQAVVDALPLHDGQRVLDFCAGGGGKALAMAGRVDAQIYAHDADPRRMKDVPERAERAGVSLPCMTTEELAQYAPFDLVLCDAPCSGSGSWRRDPEGKWRLTQDALDDVVAVQGDILDAAAPLVAAGGVLAFATCSMLDVENGNQTRAFLDRHPEWEHLSEHAWHVHTGTDGFYVSMFRRPGKH
ncbi:RsmB/NOP family class I SAM-dependent RNA methyltransferase [Tritonibacter scottomollicae]|uniref:RsmB/NOP family class I SAM-dependent RNA methyltransferase n=1 Tax=Tritonibacter scottomollicae TaxID=483013 RepID=A0ABZ0HI98_TRISK|nr:RsmB/NOP family class I SAM-dependent RNA methyltransferase [Tritonibacter scottomollicae]WOI34196.1 RsmB/NOP family class I SAM-dependent RNA methyltransferase [Tritonibacter scottomollicae]